MGAQAPFIHARGLRKEFAAARARPCASRRCTTFARSLTLGTVGPANLVDAGYLLSLGLCGIWLARRRMAGLLLT